jgi:hypothetical protein
MDSSILLRVLFAVGIVLALIAAFVSSPILPWVVGGFGILTGIIGWTRQTRGLVIAAIVLVVSLSAILQQPFNPQWLNDAVFFVRVFVAHVGLGAGVLTIFAPPSAVWL